MTKFKKALENYQEAGEQLIQSALANNITESQVCSAFENLLVTFIFSAEREFKQRSKNDEK